MIDFCSKVVVTEEERDLIVDSLPQEWHTQVMYFNPEKNKELHIKINAQTIEETQKWLHAFQKLTNTFYSINSAYNSKGKRVHYKKRYHCHHNTRNKDTYDSDTRPSTKNTRCPSSLIISIRTIVEKYQGKGTPADPAKPCEIKIKLEHNHPVDTPDILKFKKVSPEVKEKLLELFSQGYTVSNALKHIKYTIKLKYENYEEIYNDRSQCPDYSYCYYLYLKYQNNCNTALGEGEIDEHHLSNLFDKYNKQTNDISAQLAVCEDGSVVCICPPLSKRVYQLEDTTRIVFVDSFASVDNNGNRIFLFLTPSEVGCLPLGAIITSSESDNMTRIGLSLLQDMLSEDSSNTNLEKATIFVIDEFLGEDDILPSSWPACQTCLSINHVLQNIWHWLSNSSNNIAADDRPLLFKDFYNALYASSEENFNICFEVAQESARKYENYFNLLYNYYEKKEYWALYCRPYVLQSDSNSLKYSESAIRFLRRNMFSLFKTFEFTTITEFIIREFFPYFERRLLEIASNTIPPVFFSNSKQFPPEMVNNIQNLGPNMRIVPCENNSGTNYIINVDLLTCTCSNANSSCICIHVQCVSILLYQKTFEDCCQQDDVKKKCHFLATGDTLQIVPEDPLQLFQPFEDTTNEEFPEETMEHCEDIDAIEGVQEVMEMEDENGDLEVAEKEEQMKQCKEIWKAITNVFEDLIVESSDDFVPIINQVASKFEAINTVTDFKSAFNIFEPSQSKRSTKKKLEIDADANITIIEEDIDHFIVQIRDDISNC